MIAIITYDAPHRKTQDLVTRLVLNGYTQIHLLATPWVKRKNYQPIFTHRPSNKVKVTIEDLSSRLNIDFTKIEVQELNDFLQQNTFDHILIGGAGILPQDLVQNHKLINGHPGYLPNVKGLDALKWAIYNGQPIGATTHYVSEKTDEGELIERKIIPIYFEDSFHSVANRLYETEIDMLVNSIQRIENNDANFESLEDNRYKANRRMPHHLEMVMINRFDNIRQKSDSRKLASK